MQTSLPSTVHVRPTEKQAPITPTKTPKAPPVRPEPSSSNFVEHLECETAESIEL